MNTSPTGNSESTSTASPEAVPTTHAPEPTLEPAVSESQAELSTEKLAIQDITFPRTRLGKPPGTLAGRVRRRRLEFEEPADVSEFTKFTRSGLTTKQKQQLGLATRQVTGAAALRATRAARGRPRNFNALLKDSGAGSLKLADLPRGVGGLGKAQSRFAGKGLFERTDTELLRAGSFPAELKASKLIQEPLVDIGSASKLSEATLIKSLTKGTTKLTSKALTKTSIKEILKESTKELQKSTQKQAQKSLLKQIQKQITKSTTKGGLRGPPARPTRRPTTEIIIPGLLKLPARRTKRGGGDLDGYDVFARPIKKKGAKKPNLVKVNKGGALTKNRARDFRNFILDTSLARTGKIARSASKKFTRVRGVPLGYADRTRNKFRKFKSVKGKRTVLPKGAVIEFNTRLLDTPQERRQIGLRKRIAQVNRRRVPNILN